MPHYIVKLETPKGPRYLDWSTIVDAPVTYGMTLDEFIDWYLAEYGEQGRRTLPERLARVEAKGTSSMIHDTLDELISCNRAGPRESHLSMKQLVARYCS